MPPATMAEFFPELPCYDRVNLAILLGCGAICLILWLSGLILRHPACLSSQRLPAIPFFPHSAFPNIWEQSFTLLFILLYMALISLDLLAGDKHPDRSEESPWSSCLFLAILYLPFILRMSAMRPGGRGSLAQYALLSLSAIALTYTAAFLEEYVQLVKWMVEATDTPETQDVIRVLQQSPSLDSTIALLFAALVVAPIGEECVFRGFLYTTLRRQCGALPAALAAGLFFGAVHVSLPQLLPLSVFGIAQCWVYEKSRTLWAPIATHFLFNASSAFFVLFAPMSSSAI